MPKGKKTSSEETTSEGTTFTELRLTLRDSQIRRVAALAEAKTVLQQQGLFGAIPAPAADDLLRVAEYILEG